MLLPPNTGSVTAFKFRDPEGHPLELISFPQGVGAPVWHETSGQGLLGYDHTAISVMDADRSLAFYQGLLGFTIASRSLNTGPEQDRLDGLAGCAVDVVVASARQIHKVRDLDMLAGRLEASGAIFVSPGIVTLKAGTKAAGKAAFIPDTDCSHFSRPHRPRRPRLSDRESERLPSIVSCGS